MKPFKYKTSFSSSILACSHLESEEWIPWNISTASLESLKDVMPEGIDLEKNIDLLGVAFNGAVVNKFNKNGDGINTKTAIAIKDYFINKPANIEHQREKVVGHIVGSSFSDFKTNKLLTDQDVSSLDGPFNIALAAVVYKTVNPAFAGLIEQSIEGEIDETISASWEIGFNDFAIALGSKDLNEAELITDFNKVSELKQYLKAEGGTGQMKDGTPVYRLVTGDIYPLGIGFTTNPAAEVEGVYIVKDEDLSLAEGQDSEKKSEQNISQNSDSAVNTQNTPNKQFITMENENLIKKLEEILDDKLSSQEHAKETVASLAGVISDAIREKSDVYVQERKELEEEQERLAKQEEEFKGSVAELESKLSETESQLNELQQEKQERESKSLFNSRMAQIDEEYELDDADRQVVASELNAIESSEEAFASLQEKFAVIWKTKSKAFIEEYNSEMEAKINAEVEKRLTELSESTASEETVEVESDVLENAEVEEAVVTNNNAEAAKKEETLTEKFKSVFNKENINIKY